MGLSFRKRRRERARYVTGGQTVAFRRRGMGSHWRIKSRVMTGQDWHFRKIAGTAMQRLGFGGEPGAGLEFGGCRWETARLERGQRQ